MRAFFTCGIILLLAAHPAAAAAEAHYAEQRAAMLRAIERDAIDTADYTGRRGFDARVMAEIGAVPRHLFVPADEASRAYANRPLPIGYGQTISQPYIVALMTDLLDLGAGDVVFELGTGSGYQAAVLAGLVAEVYTVEIVAELAALAAERLARLGYDNITAWHGDGYYGWPEKAPFDAIIVTAAASHVPPPLIAQLKPGGRMVIPVGAAFLVQQLMLIEKAADGDIITRHILPVVFVPLTGER
ncbi:MAG: protein-L-isoaspartate(D-aspartate) O-methyltransferase [Alphaproteobacteria bacterium]|jgi:protein-L-isoaspartate(D-aspartate) O-methyltransferase|nr:protein-L-isoaspartate(D-aspartate) O-methyltransferase [Alphaproteobacteria bacterium]